MNRYAPSGLTRTSDGPIPVAKADNIRQLFARSEERDRYGLESIMGRTMQGRLATAIVSNDRVSHDLALDAEAASRAALTVCECLIIALTERGVLDREEMRGTLEDARNAHFYSSGTAEERSIHRRAAEMIGRLMESVDAV